MLNKGRLYPRLPNTRAGVGLDKGQLYGSVWFYEETSTTFPADFTAQVARMVTKQSTATGQSKRSVTDLASFSGQTKRSIIEVIVVSFIAQAKRVVLKDATATAQTQRNVSLLTSITGQAKRKLTRIAMTTAQTRRIVVAIAQVAGQVNRTIKKLTNLTGQTNRRLTALSANMYQSMRKVTVRATVATQSKRTVRTLAAFSAQATRKLFKLTEFIGQTVRRIVDLLRKPPCITWRELSDIVAFQELPDIGISSELPDIITWKEVCPVNIRVGERKPAAAELKPQGLKPNQSIRIDSDATFKFVDINEQVLDSGVAQADGTKVFVMIEPIVGQEGDYQKVLFTCPVTVLKDGVPDMDYEQMIIIPSVTVHVQAAGYKA